MPADYRAALPTNAEGEPRIKIVQALYRYEDRAPGEVGWIEVRKLSIDEWDAAIAAHRDIYSDTRGMDSFPSFSWGDLQNRATNWCGSCVSRPGPMSGWRHSSSIGSSTTALR
jgi:hypothetical protein